MKSNDNKINNSGYYDENFYSYDDFNDNGNIDEANKKKKEKKRKIIILVIILLLFLISIGVIIFFLGRNNDGNNEVPKPVLVPNITLSLSEFNLTVGSSKSITYTIENDNGNVVVTWSSSDKSVATVSENGTVKGIKDGFAIITASYTIDGVEYKKNCSVSVKKKATTQTKDTTDPKLSYTITNGKENAWVNKDVSIKVTASDNSGSVNLKYTTNCNTDCKYTTVSNNVIKISSSGSSVVRIVATDKAGNSTEKKVTVMIDKTKPTCSLAVSEEGALSAKYTDTGGSSISYYGFSSSYSGTSGNSQNINKIGSYSYYVKDKAGNTNTCSLVVKNKTKYRYQDCISCKRCRDAGCQYFSGWTAVGSGSIGSSNDSFVGIYDKKVCEYFTTGLYRCQSYKRVCSTYKDSCDKCGGCDNWGEFSAWTDTKYTESSSRKVETKTVYVGE